MAPAAACQRHSSEPHAPEEAAEQHSRPTKAPGDMASRAAALILLGVVCLGLAAADIPTDCCLKVSDKQLNFKNILDYSIQEAGRGCDIGATVFFMRNQSRFCITHPSGSKWVQRYIQRLEKNKKTRA